MSGQFAIKDVKNLGLCGEVKDGLLFDDSDNAVKSSQKVECIFQTRAMGVIPRIEVVAA